MLELLVLIAAAAVFLWLRDQRADHRGDQEAHRIELAVVRAELVSLAQAHAEQLERIFESHRQEIAALHQARVAEVADLLQRIQAPEQAVVQHMAENVTDPPPVDLDDDEQMVRVYEERMQGFARELEALQ